MRDFVRTIVASNSKRSRDDKTDKTKFTEAEKNWNLEKLYEDVRTAKQQCGSVKLKVLTDTEKCHLRGLLCGYSPEEIAKERGVKVGTINDTLSKTLYRYIEELLNYEKKIRHWSDVPDCLEKARYKLQSSDQSQLSHPLQGKEENTLETSHSHKIGAISFLEYFSKAVDQLKSKDLDVRIGAISTLGTLAKYSSPSEHWTIMEYLAAFIRTNAPRKEEEEGERSPKIPDDIQAALTVIGQRDPNHDKGVLDLSNTDLRRAKLQRAKLQRVNFTKAHLEGANLYKAHLEQAILDDAYLEQVNLMEAHLEGASLERTHLEQATLIHAHLQGTKLRLAHLEFTDFGYASLERADLLGANLQDARLIKTNLEKADLCGANLRCAILQEVCLLGANLRNTALHEAHLEGTDITVAKNLELKQIQSAYGDSPSSLPLINVSPEYWKM